MLSAIWVTLGVLIFAVFISTNLFRHLRPQAILPDYKPCSGNWHEEELAGCCELLDVPQQPINTYSNLAYLAAGILVHFHLETGPSFVFAVTMTYLSIGSALYHATSTRWAAMLDVTGIYAVFTAVAAYALLTLLFGAREYTAFVMFVVAGIATSVLYTVGKPRRRPEGPGTHTTTEHVHAPTRAPEAGAMSAAEPCEQAPAPGATSGTRPNRSNRMRTVIAACLVISYLCVLGRMWFTHDWSDWPFLVGSLVVFGIAYVSWGMDRKRTFRPIPWGHGLWHVLTAAASALIFYAVDATVSRPGAG